MNAMYQVWLRRLALTCVSALGLTGIVGTGGGGTEVENNPVGECVDSSIVLELVSGDGQQARGGDPLPAELVVRVTCSRPQLDNTTRVEPVADESIEWVVTSGNGTLSRSQTQTAPFQSPDWGQATVAWTLGPQAGDQQVTARRLFGGNTVVFTATATAPGAIDCNSAGGTDHTSEGMITTAATWTKAGSPHYKTGTTGVDIFNGGRLTIEPGAVVCIAGQFLVRNASLIAEGTVAEPIRFSVRDSAPQQFVGGFIGAYRFDLQHSSGGAPSGSSFKHVVVENGGLINGFEHPVVVEDSRFVVTDPDHPSRPDCVKFNLNQAGDSTVLRRTVIDGFGATRANAGCSTGIVQIASQSIFATTAFTFGLRVLNTRATTGFAALQIDSAGRAATLTDCEVSGTSVGHGVRVDGFPELKVVGCNLTNNAGSGLIDARIGTGLAPIDARGNWWGDPAGPNGSGGDGVTGNVDATNPLAAAAVLGY